MNIQKKVEECGFDSLESFLQHCSEHSQQHKPLFHKHEIALMVRLTGSPRYWPRPHDIEKGSMKRYGFDSAMADLLARYRLINKRLEASNSYEDLLQVAMMIITTTHPNLGMVSGPISTGGKGSIQLNILAMQEYIEELYQTGENIFDQTIFEKPMERLKDKEVTYDNRILKDFYLPIFESGYLKKMFFMQDYKSSLGASWEDEQIIRLRIKSSYQTIQV